MHKKRTNFLKSLIKFELYSWIGRHFLKKKLKPFKGKKTYVDLGVGTNYTEGWINVDFYIFKFRFWKKYQGLPDIGMDLRYPINCDDNCIDGVYSGHTIEHLSPDDANNFLKEIHRILKPGAWLRINHPDLEKYIEFYNGKIPHEGFKKYKSGEEAIHSLTQCDGHISVWNEKTLSSKLKEIGFLNIRKVEYGKEGSDPELIKEQPIRYWNSLAMEAQK